MKTLLITVLFAFWTTLVLGQEISENNDPKKHPGLINTSHVDQINGRPIDFYLNHKRIDTPAKLFYKGQYALYDDEETFNFLNGILTDDPDTRPFYLFIYNQAMKVTDGALSEYMTGICKRYLEKHPCEFLFSLKNNNPNIDLEKWTEFIAFELYDKGMFDQFAFDIEKKVEVACSSGKSSWDKVKAKVEGKLEDK